MTAVRKRGSWDALNLPEILVIGGESFMDEPMLDGITNQGIAVNTVRYGYWVAKALSERKPDLILLDVSLPETDGIAVCQQLKAGADTETIPVVLMLASDDLDKRALGFQAGAVDYLIKPLVFEEVLAKLGLHIRQRATAYQSALQIESGEIPSHRNQDNAGRPLEAFDCQACSELPLRERYFRDITGRKAAEEALRASEERMRLFFERQLVGMAITSPDKGWLQTNDKLCQMLGYSRSELTGLSWAELTHPEDLALDTAQFERLLNGEIDRYMLQKRFIRNDGSIVFTDLSVGCVRREDRSVDYVMVQLKDITERKRMEAEARNHLYFFESMDRVNRAIQGSNDMETVLNDVLDTVLAIFDSDRAFLCYPCDPEAESWYIPFEKTKPEFPGALALGAVMPMAADVATTFRILLDADAPVTLGHQHSLPAEASEHFGFKSQNSMAIYPKADKPWHFGIQQCSRVRVWTAEETKLFQEIGRRLADALTGLLAYRTLQASEREYRALVENAPFGIARYDVQGRITYLNPRVAKAINKTLAEVLGRRPTECLSREYYAEYEKYLLEVVTSGAEAEFDLIFPLDDRLEICSITMLAERDTEGNISGVLAIGRDMTQQRRAEDSLRRSEALYRSMVGAMVEGVIVQSRDRKILSINSAAEKILRLSAESMLGKSLLDAEQQVLTADGMPFPEDQRPAILSLQTGQPQFDVSMGLVWADGQVVWILVNSQPLFMEGDVEPYAVVSTFHDITEKKQAEVEKLKLIATLEQNEALLKERLMLERRFSRMADHIPGFLFTYKMDANGHGSFPYVSSGIQELYGFQAEDGVADMAPLYNMAHPEDRPRLEAAIAESVRNVEEFHYEFRICHPTKGVLWLEAKAMPTVKDDGGIEFHGFMQDITERKRVEQTLQFVAQSGWQESREAFLASLANFMGRMLDVDYILVDKLSTDPAFAETIVVYHKGEILPNMRYSLAGTPCNNVMEGELCCYSYKVQQQFPDDTLLKDMKVESYIGLPLRDSAGNTIGLIAVMDGKPLPDSNRIISILQLVAIRVAAELERERYERALAESRQFLHSVIDTIAEPVFVKNRRHRWILVNSAFCKLIGRPQDALVGKSDYDFFPQAEADEFWARDEEVFRTGEENVNEETFTDRNGVTRTIIIKKTLYIDDDGEGVLVGIILDITKHKQMEATIRKREEEFRTLAENLPDVIVRYDQSLRRTYINKGYSKMLDPLGVEILGKTPEEFWKVLHPNADEFTRILQRVIATGNPETTLMQSEAGAGRLIYWTMGLVPEFDQDGSVSGVLSCATDITELKEYQREVEASRARLRALAKRSEQMLEDDRKRIARELHDDLGQRLTALKLDLSRLTLRFGQSNPELRQQVQEMEVDMGATIQIVRDVATRLRPAALEMGIVSALEWLIQEFRKRTNVSCRLRLPERNVGLDDSQATVLFRIVQESLTNIMRYAMASEVDIVLSCVGQYYRLEIRDNGVGFDAEDSRKAGSFGLIGIEERALSLGGDMRIETAPEQGLKLTVCIPVFHGHGENHDQCFNG